MLNETAVRKLLAPFDLNLSGHQIGQILTYLALLLRWNQKINLTAIQTEEECVTRHFGESLSLSRWIEIQGQLLDVGSGAGFPGLALKIAYPKVSTTLLEPNAKKRAFLKEAARACGMETVEVRPERLEELLRQIDRQWFDNVTARAVGKLGRLVPGAAQCLKVGGRIFLWVSQAQTKALSELEPSLLWEAPIPLPLSSQREIWRGRRVR